MSSGSRHGLYYCFETVRGTTEATPAWKALRHLPGTSLGLTRSTLESSEVRPDRQKVCFRHGTDRVAGAIPIELSYGSFDDVLEALFMGTWATDTPIAGTDQLEVGVLRRYMSMMEHYADMDGADKPYHIWTAIEATKLDLTIVPDSAVSGSISVIGKDLTVGTAEPAGSTYPAATTTCAMDAYTGTIETGGVGSAVITEMQLSIDNGMEPRFVVGERESILPEVKQSDVNGTLTAWFDSSTVLEKFIDETHESVEVTLLDPAGNQYKIILPEVVYTGGEINRPEGSNIITMPFQAVYNSTAQTNLILERTPV